MTAFYNKIYFDILQKEIEKDYIGDTIERAQSVVQNKRQIRLAGSRHIQDPVEVYLKRFSSALDLLNEDQPYPIDIVSTCIRTWQKSQRNSQKPSVGQNLQKEQQTQRDTNSSLSLGQ